MRPERLTEFDSWRSLGLSEAGALEALRGHDPVATVLIEGDGFDRMADQFQALGLSESAAKTATSGRDTETDARVALKAPAPPAAEDEPVPTVPPTAAAKKAAAGQAVKAPAKKAAAKKEPAKKVAAKESADLGAAVARHEAKGMTFLEAMRAAEDEVNPRVAVLRTIDIHETRENRP